MKALYAVLFLFVMFWSGQGYAETVKFFEAIHDVPLMPGLVELADEAVAFDKAGGRIVESAADAGDVSYEAIRQYYISALPQFGWKASGPGRFVRQQEILELTFDSNEKSGVLRVLIQPR